MPKMDRDDEIENGRMFNELCSVNLPRSDLKTRPWQPTTTLYEQRQFKQSTESSGKTPTTSTTKTKGGKQVVTKEEAQKLRDSVLKSSRPLNPYFERSSSSSPVMNYTSISYMNNEKKIETPNRPTPEVRSVPTIRTKLQAANKAPEISVNTPKTNSRHITKHYLSEFARPQRIYVDTYEDDTPNTGLHTLEQLEAENRRRIAREQTSDEFASPSTYYFSDECSSTAERNEESPKYASYTAFPRCAECGLQITDMILQAVGKSFHPTCFRCFECQKSLDGVPFAINDAEQVYCMADYERLYVPICARCMTPIKPSNAYGQIVRVVSMDKEYHISCYSCESCGLQLTNEDHRRCFPLLNGTLLCRQCNLRWQQLGGSVSPLTDL